MKIIRKNLTFCAMNGTFHEVSSGAVYCSVFHSCCTGEKVLGAGAWACL